ncbi:3-oxoacyl-[acyl-carrier-protein] reductase FabG [Xanthomonas hydrangeae]|nr:3-oxoacyl-[acyl-carrier-protein] reductase FabG [Xanthomonas hydrangeae]CAD7722147.1 3-oxoacyl-[acyl-carrier-protein] reductase FabG [Xanthomonas hydrangeae]CAD7728149.1 3-oxoacyl-[acyl-carrier-protein] reductase FabG [Xanthomonas hydrangeae]CAD7728153.1 3-oxoacyl-[acyl-carrier-protein] reductase FabG [Xanthomonas hydrangeae]
MSTSAPVALITGANKGIGLALVDHLANAGWTVYLGSRDPARGQAARDGLSQADNVHVLPLDITDPGSIAAAVAQLQADGATLDVLVNNAAVIVGDGTPATATLDNLRATYEVNLFGQVAITQALLPLLRAGTLKRIVNVSSDLGSLSLHGDPGYRYHAVNVLGYCSSKTALNAFTVLLAKELRSEGFAVNAVNPGYTATDLNGHTGPGSVEQAAATVAHVAMSELGTGGYYTEGGRLAW